MPSHHQHLHRRQWPVGQGWHAIKSDIQKLANDLTNTSPDQAKDLNSQPEIKIRAPAPAPGPSTIFKTIYKTMEPTFTGEIGGYLTVSDPIEASQTIAPAPAPTSDDFTPMAQAMTTDAAAAPAGAPAGAPVGAPILPGSLVPSSVGDFTDRTGLAIQTAPTTAQNQATSTPDSGSTFTTPAASSSTAKASESSGESGAAAKAGIAIGVLAGFLVVGLAIFFLFSRRRKQKEKQEAEDNEKNNAPFAAAVPAVQVRPPSVHSARSTQTTRTTATAPRLSLRPGSQFNPEFGERRSSKGAAMALALGPAPSNSPANRQVGQSPWERPTTSQSSNQDNPFGDYAERYDGAQQSRGATMEEPNNPFTAPEHVVGVAQTTDLPRQAPTGLPASDVGAGAVLTRKQSVRKDVPQPLDLTTANEEDPLPLPSLSQPSPTGTEFSFTSVAPGQSPGPSQSANAIAAAGGPPHSTVHRVQLDFKPTLEDEMELRAGQLVRLLHEYDDGWALCIRLDRSQQGVAPRTCLSTRPVKPRPAGGPPGAPNGPPNNRRQGPMSPQGGGRPQSPASQRGPQSPAMRRPQSPGGPMNGRPASPGPRPSSSAGARGQSPGPRQRGNSESGQNPQRPGPPGPSPLQQQQQPRPIGRKPVPGMAY